MSSVPRFAVNMTTFTWTSSTASTSMIMTGDNWEYQTNANKHWGFWISPSSFLLPSQGQFSNHTVQIWYAYCQEYLLASHITLSRSVPKSDEVGGGHPSPLTGRPPLSSLTISLLHSLYMLMFYHIELKLKTPWKNLKAAQPKFHDLAAVRPLQILLALLGRVCTVGLLQPTPRN